MADSPVLPTADAPTRTAWLIERGQAENQGPTIWFCGTGGNNGDDWTDDANKAVKYASRESAERTIASRSGVVGVHAQFGRAAEHVFLNSRPPADAPTAEEIDEMLRVYTRACELVILEGDSKLSHTLKIRTNLRDKIRQRFTSLIAADADRRELVTVLADMVSKSTDYGQQDGGFVASYIIPTGPMHRAIPLLSRLGVEARPGFDGRKPLTEEQKRVVEDFSREMRETVIPEILDAQRRRAEAFNERKGLPLRAARSPEGEPNAD